MNTSVITPKEVATLNAARDVMETIRQRHHGTVVHGVATLAEHAVFSVLNYCNAYLDADLSHRDMHNNG